MTGGDDARLREAEERFRLAFENAPIGMAIRSLDGRFLRVNASLCEITGYTAEELLGRTVRDVIHPDDFEADLADVRNLLAGAVRTYSIEKRYIHADGHEVWINLSVSLVRDADDEPLYFINQIEDITARRRTEDQLWELALVDDLTGLHNRRSFMLLAEQAVKEAARAERPVIALFLDVDHLKEINDHHGHAEGDRALRLVADGLRAACRSSDIIGRLSGDEFAVLLAEAHELDGLEGRVRRRIAEAAEGVGYPLSVSIGLAMCAAGQECLLADLFERADQAMYAEKAAKREEAPPRD